MSDEVADSAGVLAKLAQYSLLHRMLTTETQDDGASGEGAVRRQLPFKSYGDTPDVRLPPDDATIAMPLRSALRQRRSHHSVAPTVLTLGTVSTLLGMSYGSHRSATAYGYRHYPLSIAPSAGGLQPINLYVVAQNIEDVPPGAYYFHPYDRTLNAVHRNPVRPLLERCLEQPEFATWPATLVLTCSLRRVFWKYPLRHYRTVHVDAGIVAQNIYLVATALGLAVCAIAGFRDREARDLLAIDDAAEFVALLVAVGNAPDSTTRRT